MNDILITLGIGLVTGFASGLMGIGGSSLGTPLLRLLLNAPPLIALATPMPVMLPSAISGGLAYHKNKKIDFPLAGFMLITALPMTWVGASATSFVSGQMLMVFTAIFLMIVGVSFLLRDMLMKPAANSEAEIAPIVAWKALVAGAVGGFLAGLLAIGGGVLYVPAILRLFHRPMKVALATSLVVVAMVAIPGSIKHAMMGHIDWKLTGVLCISVIPASFLGAKLALRLRNRTLERIFGIWTLCFGIYFLFSQL